MAGRPFSYNRARLSNGDAATEIAACRPDELLTARPRARMNGGMFDPGRAADSPAAVEILRGGANVLTTHGVGDYPGLLVVQSPGWQVRVIVPEDGQTIEARGGEALYAYELPNGVAAAGFTLAAGDRATRVRSDLPHSLSEWRLERAAR